MYKSPGLTSYSPDSSMEYVISRSVEAIIDPVIDTVSQEGSEVLGIVISSLLHIMFGKTLGNQFYYEETPQGTAIADSIKIIRLLTFFNVNMIIVIFFKDMNSIELLEENHTLDSYVFGLGISVRHIHKSLTNGMISMILTLLNDNSLGGGGRGMKYNKNEKAGDLYNKSKVLNTENLELLIHKIFNNFSLEDFKGLFKLHSTDPYNINHKLNKKHWGNSFTKILYEARHHSKQQKQIKSINLDSETNIKSILRKKGISESELNQIMDVLSGKAGDVEKKQLFMGGSTQSQTENKLFSTEPFVEDSLSDEDIIYYKLFIFELLLNSDKFIEAFVIMFNVGCRVINKTIRITIPMIRSLGKRTFQNVGSFIFSLGGPFTEVFWLGFSSLIGIADMGSAMTGFSQVFDDIIPENTKSGKRYDIDHKSNSIKFTKREKDILNDLLETTSHVGGGGRGGGRLEKRIKKCFNKYK